MPFSLRHPRKNRQSNQRISRILVDERVREREGKTGDEADDRTRGDSGSDMGSRQDARDRSPEAWSGTAKLMSAAPVGNLYIYSFDGKLLQLYDVYGALLKDYIYMGDRLIAEYDHVGARLLYYTPDQINSTRVVTDQGGTIVYSAAHDPYGGIQQTWVSTYDPQLKFSGKERDAESGLDYFGARYYDRSQYRFLSVDPVLNLIPQESRPQVWCSYVYCGDNPVIFSDPTGRSYLVFNPWANTLTLYKDNGEFVGSWSASNNVVEGHDEFADGCWCFGIGNFTQVNWKGEPIDCGTPETAFGSWGMLEVYNNKGKVIHSGREYGTGEGWKAKTFGCVRTTDMAMVLMWFFDNWVEKIHRIYVYRLVSTELPAPRSWPNLVAPGDPR